MGTLGVFSGKLHFPCSFEMLYRQLGFDAPLPSSCRALVKFSLTFDRQSPQGSAVAIKSHLLDPAQSGATFRANCQEILVPTLSVLSSIISRRVSSLVTFCPFKLHNFLQIFVLFMFC